MKLDDWNNSAEVYSELPDVSNIEVNYRAILAHLGACEGKTVLDYGCGAGRLAQRMERLGACVTGVDISLPMICIAQKVSQNAGSAVKYIHMPNNSLDFLDSGSFDVVVANLVVMMYSSKESIAQSMREICRVLKRGGRFINVFTHPCFVDRGAHDYRNVFFGGFIYLKEGYAYKFVLRDADGVEVDKDFRDYHYTLTTYFRLTLEAGFDILDFEELGYPEDARATYSIPEEYCTYPLAALIDARKHRR
nr:methyltransferase domain protein [uncultured bacterium]